MSSNSFLNSELVALLSEATHSKQIAWADYNDLLLATQEGQLTPEDSSTADRLLYAIRRGLIEVH